MRPRGLPKDKKRPHLLFLFFPSLLFFSSKPSISLELSSVISASFAKNRAVLFCLFSIILASSNILTRSLFFNLHYYQHCTLSPVDNCLCIAQYCLARSRLRIASIVFSCLAINIALALNLIPFYFQYQQSSVCFNSSNKRSGSLVIAAITRTQSGPASIPRQSTCSCTLILRFTVLADTDQQPSTSNPF